MGAVHVAVNVGPLDDWSRAEEVELLVDTGATFTVLPGDTWLRLGVRGEFTRQLRTADGRLVERPQGLAYIEIGDHAGTVPVVEGVNGDVPVLGVATLEILGLAVDPVYGELRPAEHLYLSEVSNG